MSEPQHRSEFPEVERLTRAFKAIERERMQDIPILNRALEVEAVGFALFEERLLGILVTPWFINLIMLPHAREDWSGVGAGTKIAHRLPSGFYEFVAAYEPAVGYYQSCSLMSPVTEIADQSTAREVARSALATIMKPENGGGSGTPQTGREVSRRELLRGRLSKR